MTPVNPPPVGPRSPGGDPDRPPPPMASRPPAASSANKQLGPTFGLELARAGLGDIPISWTSDGQIFGRENLTVQQNATLDAVIAAHDHTKEIVPAIISRRQFFQASAMKGMISQQEALDAVRHGTIPAQMQAGLEPLPPDEKFAAEMLLSGAGEFDRSHSLVEKFGELMGMPPAALDEIWRFAATL